MMGRKMEKVRVTDLRSIVVMRTERHPKTIKEGRRKMPLRKWKRTKNSAVTRNARAH